MSLKNFFSGNATTATGASVAGYLKAPLLADRCFRIFGSPYASVTHQHITYLYLKRVPIKTYCGTFASTKLYSVYYGAASVFCALTPEKECCLLPWHLMERVEERHAQHRGDAHVAGATSSEDTPRREQRAGKHCPYLQHGRKVLLERTTHPQLHMLSWMFMVYGNWWLTLTGMMYRWLHGDGEGIVSGYMNYFLMMNSVGVVGPLRNRFRKLMCGLLEVHGVSEATRPFMVEHFEALCTALDDHFGVLMSQQQPPAQSVANPRDRAETSNPSSPQFPVYLLGTPHPTLADVAIGAAFSSYFLMDLGTAEMIDSKHPHLKQYLNGVAGFQQLHQGEYHPEPPSDVLEAHEASDFPDAVPESLKSVLMQLEAVFPFLVDQCEAFRVFMSGDRALDDLKRMTLDEDAEGGLHGLDAYVLPQRTPISTVMLVDRHLLTVFCRAQDLEIATTAAREILDVELAPFNKESSKEEEQRGAASPQIGPPSALVAAPPMSSLILERGTFVDPVALIDGLKRSEYSLTDVLRRGAQSPFPPPDPNDENSIPHVYSKKGSKTLHRFGNHETALQLRRSQRSVADVMASLYQSVWQMHCPQFTLSAVSQNRRVFVAVIPEHEYTKKRQRDHMATAASATK